MRPFSKCRNIDGDWAVFEDTRGHPLSSFAEKHDAIEFASDVARGRCRTAGIRVLAADGTVLGARTVGPDTIGVWD
jgi:hypothetical protein